MATVKIQVLQPFGEFVDGEAEVEEDRLEYLESKGLAKRLKGSSASKDSGEPNSPETDDPRLDTALNTIGEKLSLKRVEGASIIDYAEALAGMKPDGAESTEKKEEKTFEQFLLEKFPEQVVKNLVEAGFLSPEDIIDAEDKQFEDVEGVGSATITKLREAADEFSL